MFSWPEQGFRYYELWYSLAEIVAVSGIQWSCGSTEIPGTETKQMLLNEATLYLMWLRCTSRWYKDPFNILFKIHSKNFGILYAGLWNTHGKHLGFMFVRQWKWKSLCFTYDTFTGTYLISKLCHVQKSQLNITCWSVTENSEETCMFEL